MYIMQRPPVSTLYESIIFVSFISTLCAVILELFRKDSLGILIGSISGSIFHYIGFKYAADGDTLGMLVAVLNSNFWLATHVTTITNGNGASLMAGFMGHVYLALAILKPDKSNLNTFLYIGSFLFFISILDVFLNSFFCIKA